MIFERCLAKLKDGKILGRLLWNRNVSIRKRRNEIIMIYENVVTRTKNEGRWKPTNDDMLADDWFVKGDVEGE